MEMELVELLTRDRAALERDLVDDLRRAGPHYSTASVDLVRERCARLVGAFVESASGNPAPFVNYVRRIARERGAEGYGLDEIQQALSSLEARAWQVPVEGSSVGSLVRHLSIVTGTIGRAKDELARLFLEQKRAADGTIALLERRLDELSKGTEGHVEPEN